EQGSLFAPAEQRLLVALVRRALALPADQRIAAIDTRFAGLDEAAVATRIAELYAATTLLDPERREALLQADAATLAEHTDPLLQLAIAWAAERRAQRQRERDWLARSALHRPVWR